MAAALLGPEIDPAQVILDRIAALEVERARIEAAVAVQMLDFEEVRRRESEVLVDRERAHAMVAFAADELSRVLLHAPRSVQHRLAAVRRVRGRLPLTWQAHLDGLIDAYRLQLIASAAGKLHSLDSFVDLDAKAVAYASTHAPSQVKGWLNRFLNRVEPEAAAARARDAQARRAVWVKHEDDGVSLLTARLKTTDAVDIDAFLTLLAKNKQSDGRTLDQMRADALVDRLLGRAWTRDNDVPTHRKTVIGVVVPVESLAGLTNEPGESPDGAFALPAELVRELAAEPGTIFYRILKTPLGKILDITEIGYRPSSKLRRAVEVRDGVCQFSTCSRPAVDCDLDHRLPWPHGPTAASNLVALCRRHHRIKTLLGDRFDLS